MPTPPPAPGALEETAAGLKALGHRDRLRIAIALAGDEHTVTELQKKLGMHQAAVSQQLARLRAAGLVSLRPDGKLHWYRLADPSVPCLLECLGLRPAKRSGASRRR